MDIWTKVNKESMFFIYYLPDMKLDDGEYSCAQVTINSL